ncbi:MAG: ATP-dependent sacrificial sulfur transferase LarE [Fuerstiella sp.]
MTSNSEFKAHQLVQHVSRLGSVAVAFSGGVDSAVIAKASVLALNDRAIAVTAVSPSLAESERQIAAEVASSMGIRHVEVATNEFDNSDYSANPSNRCFFCKQTLYAAMVAKQAEWGVDVLVNGTNLDDYGDHRPGLIAANQQHVKSPLVDLKMTKADVRQIAEFWNLSVADKPASPCLSSRIAYGVEVTAERVHMIERAEAAVRRLTSIREFRVRMEANLLARIEVCPDELLELVQDPIRTELLTQLKSVGFQNITIDLAGFRSGSLNDRLPADHLTSVELKLPVDHT